MIDSSSPGDNSKTLCIRTPAVEHARLHGWPQDDAPDQPANTELPLTRDQGDAHPADTAEWDAANDIKATTPIRPHHTLLARSSRPPTSAGERLELIKAGDVLFGFRLRHLLGQGAFARVFVAQQADLADRPVVLKISGIEGIEPQTLSRLQHTHIVPIYSVHEDPRSGLRAVCMPYFGGANLSSVLERLWSGQEQPTRGTQLVDALKAVGSPAPETWGEPQESRQLSQERLAEPRTPFSLLEGLGYIEAVTWVVAQLAEGLDHAHQRGIIHRDIKPSNILLSAEGQPLLLDFNVSIDATSDVDHTLLGGTVAYAAPEHLRALSLCTLDQFQAVDRRSDIYSLGMVLVEALSGQRPFARDGSYSVPTSQLEAMVADRSEGVPSIRQSRPDAPWSLESVVRRCLEPDPAKRYQEAGHLAADLRQFLADRPLTYAPELSRVERVRKFFRRNPRLLTLSSASAVSLVLFLAIGWAFVGARTRLAETNRRLLATQARERKQAHDLGVLQCQGLVNTILGDETHLRQGIAICERTLALYALTDGRSAQEHPDWVQLAPAERLALAEDRRELLLLLAGARVRLAPGDPRELRAALALLDNAEAIPGLKPSKALWLDRANYLDQLGNHDRARTAQGLADQIKPASSRDHYLLAISHARTRTGNGYRNAVTELSEALRLNPRHYWSVMQRGICHMELGERIQAVRDFGIGTGLWPEHPWSYFNRGHVLDQSGMKAEAINDYTAALERDPQFVAALTNRGLAHLELRQCAPALADFDAALALAKGTAVIHAGRGIALEALGRHTEADAEFREAFDRAAPGPGPERTRFLWTYGFAVADRIPEAAMAAFDEVLRHEPRHPQALYGRAMLAMRGGQLASALADFNRALETDPRFTQARQSRAVVLARLNDPERANRDVDWCLEHDPGSGNSVYTAACVAALAAKVSPDPRMIDKALDLLKQALELGTDLSADNDPDLATIKQDPRFQAILTDTASSKSKK
ncbi:protein kinase domain-containing protein [Singulisphaera acidiphila]|uniref:Serine/threonine protein kinase n=1 Tax=Singulisphaera acidiphila (strain ATCC BAA-1392 / DSM 18658 / VKM B-2454 / MOB10) TaxID=886293 RepID=L0DMW8_SINAD|nr:serine/threonine-protein kinase [Singulisphaera acidiphila]AGA30724.1 serine/threonine protein kinase [Singulisphaera acidiphila DSM 18658]